ncbi:MAG: M67 family metallopeptidase [bacterium]
MAIKIDQKYFDLLKAYGEETYPDECCGFLLGAHSNGVKVVQTTLPAFNAQQRTEKYHRYLITPETFLQGEKFAKEHGLDIVGFYHSHPNAAAKPSTFDLEHGWPWYSYVIVSVTENQAQEVASWVMDSNRVEFQEEPIIIV